MALTLSMTTIRIVFYMGTGPGMPGFCYATGVAQVHMSHFIPSQSSVRRLCCHSLAGTSSSTVKRFNHILVTSVSFL